MPRYTRVVIPSTLLGREGEPAIRLVVDTEHPSGVPTAIAKAAQPYSGGNPIDDITNALNEANDS